MTLLSLINKKTPDNHIHKDSWIKFKKALSLMFF